MPKAHKHTPRWVIGQYPIVAHCTGCDMQQVVKSGNWVTPGKAQKLRNSVGIRAAL